MDTTTTGPGKCVLIREVSLFQRLTCTQKYTIGTSETVHCMCTNRPCFDQLHVHIHILKKKNLNYFLTSFTTGSNV